MHVRERGVPTLGDIAVVLIELTNGGNVHQFRSANMAKPTYQCLERRDGWIKLICLCDIQRAVIQIGKNLL